MKPDVSFVVIEFHSIDDIARCIHSIRSAVSGLSYEIIVSSNSCYGPERQREIAESFPDARWVFNERNGGFAYGMNRGLQHAAGRYLVIINPDVKINRGLADMVRFMDSNSDIGAAAPRIVSEEGDVQDSCRPYVSVAGFIGRLIRRTVRNTSAVLSHSFDYSLIQTVDWVIGAFIMVRRDAYGRTGGLDEHYFMYAEDLDWCTRIRAAGYEVVYNPSMEITYKGSRAARRSKKYARIFLKSHMHYWRKFGFFFGYPRRRNLEWGRCVPTNLKTTGQ